MMVSRCWKKMCRIYNFIRNNQENIKITKSYILFDHACINYLKCHLFMRVYEWHGTRKLAPIIFGLNGHCPLLFCQQCVQFLANKRKQSLNWKIPLEMLVREEVLGGSRLTRVLLKPSLCRCVLKRSAVEAVEQIILCQTNMILQLPHTHTRMLTKISLLSAIHWPQYSCSFIDQVQYFIQPGCTEQWSDHSGQR